ncbi:MAG: hypothetical protein VW600_16380, partial [Ferrovibrio sp.]
MTDRTIVIRFILGTPLVCVHCPAIAKPDFYGGMANLLRQNCGGCRKFAPHPKPSAPGKVPQPDDCCRNQNTRLLAQTGVSRNLSA